MKFLLDSKALWKFAWLFVLTYGLLIAPWPNWNDFCSGYYRAMCNATLTHLPGDMILRFEKTTVRLRPNLSTSISIGNERKIDRQGRYPATVLQSDTRALAWTPTALLVALILATPLTWKRKLWALALGLLVIHAYILLITALWIINRSTEVALVTLTGWQKDFAEALEYTFVEQLGISFVIPVLLWFLVMLYLEKAGIFEPSGGQFQKGR
ncbi:MAG: hypothetical protein WC076_07265 [Terrimicrobiaceae bacterium]|nr:hypothetical protein [Terrimicrobiaceae bacterium]